MPDESRENLVTFYLNDQLFALDMEPIVEAVPLPEITPLGDASTSQSGVVKGMFNLRGNIVPVVDLKTQLGLPSGPYQLSQKVLITRYGEVTFGLIVDALGTLIDLKREDVAVAPEVSCGIARHFIGGVGKLSEGLVIILAIEPLLGNLS